MDEFFKKDGRKLPPPTAKKDLSGKFVLRTGLELQQALWDRAKIDGEGLNSHVIKALKKEIAG